MRLAVLCALRAGLLAGPGVAPAVEVEVVRVRFLLAGACVGNSVGVAAVAVGERTGAASPPLDSDAFAWRLSWR